MPRNKTAKDRFGDLLQKHENDPTLFSVIVEAEKLGEEIAKEEAGKNVS